MKKHIFILAAPFISHFAPCQSLQQNNIYLEAGGNGLFGSINYERQFTKQPGFGVRIGIGFYTDAGFYLTIPVGIDYLFKLKNNRSFIDAGMGATWARENGHLFNSNSKGDNFVNFIPSIGYRRHTLKNVMWRISAAPVANKYGLVPWIGLSLGKLF